MADFYVFNATLFNSLFSLAIFMFKLDDSMMVYIFGIIRLYNLVGYFYFTSKFKWEN